MDQQKILNKTLREIKDAIGNMDNRLSPEQFAHLLAVTVTHTSRPKGEKGDAGYTPKRGVDYWTDEDIASLVTKAAGLIYTPEVGVDYYTSEDQENLIKDITEKVKGYIKNPERGKDYWTPQDLKWLEKKIIYLQKKPVNLVITRRDTEAITKSILDKPELIARALEKLIKKNRGRDRLDAKAIKNLPRGGGGTVIMGGTPTDLTGYALESYVDTAISNLVDTAPGVLDTLNELAAAIGDDPNFATTITTTIDTKVTGPASATDNAIARFDGTTGKLVQDYTSGAPTISDTGAVDISNFLQGNVQPKVFVTVGSSDADYITDGTADDVQIQAAVTAAGAAGGGIVSIKAGVYTLNSAINILDPYVTIQGAGRGVTTLRIVASATNTFGTFMIRGDSAADVWCTVKDLTLDGNYDNLTAPTDNWGGGIGTRTGWTIENVEFLSFNYFKVYSSSNNDVTVRHCQFNGTTGKSFDCLGGGGCTNYVVENCTWANGVNGSAYDHVNDVGGKFVNNHNYSASNAYWEGCVRAIIANNTFVGGAQICVQDDSGYLPTNAINPKHCKIVNNTVIGAGASGIVLRYRERGTTVPGGYNEVIGNNVYESTYAGILVIPQTTSSAIDSSLGYDKIIGNTCINNNQADVATYNTGSGVINPGGINIVKGNHYVVNDNICTDDQGTKTQHYGLQFGTTSAGGAEYAYADDLTIIGNDFSGNKTAGINFTNVLITNINSSANIGVNPDTMYAQGNITGATTFTRVNGSVIAATLTGNVTVTFTNGLVRGDELTLILTQDGTGGRTNTGLGVTLSTTAGAVDKLTYVWNGTSWLLKAATYGDSSATRLNYGLVIGTDVQAYDADLTTWAGLTPSANAQSLVTAANYAAMRTLLDLEAGTDFYSIAATDSAIDADVAIHTALTATHGVSGAIVGTTDTQTLSAKTLTSPTINSATIGTSLVPTSNDGAALGSGTNMFSDLFLASGGVVSFNNGNMTLTHTAGVLTVDGGGLGISRTGNDPYILLTRSGSAVSQLRGTTTGLQVASGGGTAWSNFASGNQTLLGYLRVGSLTAPTNTTAGDLTFVRGFATSANLTGNLIVGGTGAFTADVTVPDEAYGAGWNGSLEVPTKNAVYDQVELKAPLASPVFTGTVTLPDTVATQYRLSALNSAPANATDTGTLGEIRVVADFIYVCIATNVWVRADLATW